MEVDMPSADVGFVEVVANCITVDIIVDDSTLTGSIVVVSLTEPVTGDVFDDATGMLT
jgi:hypothetical protein